MESENHLPCVLGSGPTNWWVADGVTVRPVDKQTEGKGKRRKAAFLTKQSHNLLSGKEKRKRKEKGQFSVQWHSQMFPLAAT